MHSGQAKVGETLGVIDGLSSVRSSAAFSFFCPGIISMLDRKNKLNPRGVVPGRSSCSPAPPGLGETGVVSSRSSLYACMSSEQASSSHHH